MDDLVEFLRARDDEDEAMASAATLAPWWHNPRKQWLPPEAFEKYDLRQGEEFVGYGGPHPLTGCVAATGPADDTQSMADAEHIARHDPPRVLADIEARRKMLSHYESAVISLRNAGPVGEVHDLMTGAVNTLRAVLLDHAQVHADHPDYKAEWAPDLS